MARRGFFGTDLLLKTAKAEAVGISLMQSEIETSDATTNKKSCWKNGTTIKSVILHFILALALSALVLVLIAEDRGILAALKYPKCVNTSPSFYSDWKLLENGVCDMEFNHPDCAFDGGDCSDYNLLYSSCLVDDLSLLGNGVCDGTPYDSAVCRYDGGDCSVESVIKAKYPLCEKAAPSFSSNWNLVENDVCDMVSTKNVLLCYLFQYSILLINK